MTSSRLRPIDMATLSGPAVPMFALMMPLVIFIPPFYAEHMGLGMAAVGTLFTLGRLFDVVTDPVGGVLMDRTRHWLSKRAWMTIGALPLALATWQIFFATAPGDPAVLMAWLVVLYLGWTLMSVGIFSWASEVATDYHERSRIMGAIQMANLVGTITVLLIPTAIESFSDGENLDVRRIQAMGTAILVMLPISLAIAWRWAPADAGGGEVQSAPVLPALRAAWSNTALRRLLGADLAVGLIIGVFTSLTIFYSEIVLGLQGRAGLLQLTLLISSLIGLPVFIYLAGRIDKHTSLCIAAGLSALAGIAGAVLPVGSLPLAITCYAVFGFAGGATQMLPRAIMADVLEADEAKTSSPSTALYFSFITTTLKLGLGLGVGITFALAAAAGFDPASARTDDSAHWVIRALIGALPALLCLIIVALMWRFPVGRSVQTAQES